MADFHLSLDSTLHEARTSLASQVVSGPDLSSLVGQTRMSIQFSAGAVNQFLISEIHNTKGSEPPAVHVYPDLDNQGRITVRIGSRAHPGFLPANSVTSQDPEFLANLANFHRNDQGILRKAYFRADELQSLIKDLSGNLVFHLLSISYKEDPNEHYTLSAVFDGHDTVGLVSALPCPPHCGSDGPYQNQRHQMIKP